MKMSSEQQDLYDRIWGSHELVFDNNYIGGDMDLQCSAPVGTFNHMGFVRRDKFPHTVALANKHIAHGNRKVKRPDDFTGVVQIYLEFAYQPNENVCNWLFENIPCNKFVFRESRQGAYIHFADDSSMALFRLRFDCTTTMTSAHSDVSYD